MNKKTKKQTAVPQDEKLTWLFTTNPHGAQKLSVMGQFEDCIGNTLFTLEGGKGEAITMTGDEIESFFAEFAKLKANRK